MEAVCLGLAKCERIYEEYLIKDFPADEVKPFESIRRAAEAGRYQSWGFYEDGRLAAYAFLCDDSEGRFSLLDYYAVDASVRGQGYGRRALALLRELYQTYAGLIVESEHPDFAKDEKDLRTRRRRIAFYEGCGLAVSGVRGRAFGVEYKILYAAGREEVDDAAIAAALQDIYRLLAPGEAFERHVAIRV